MNNNSNDNNKNNWIKHQKIQHRQKKNYLNNNINFIDHTKEQIANDVNTINSFVIKKLNTIEQLENKLKKYITNNINLSQFNTILLQLRDIVEKKFKHYSNNKINNKLHYLLDNYKINESNISNDELLLD